MLSDQKLQTVHMDLGMVGMKLGKFNCWESTTKDVTARNLVVSRSIVSAFKLIFFALKTVSVWIARTLKGVKKDGLYFVEIPMPWPTCNRLPMQPSVGPLGHLAMAIVLYPRKEKETFQKSSKASSSIISVPVSQRTNGSVLRSSKPTYRSPLVGVLQPQDMKELCSVLVIVSEEARKALSEKRGKMDEKTKGRQNTHTFSVSPIQENEDRVKGQDVNKTLPDNHLSGDQAARDKCSVTGADEGDLQHKKPMSPGTLSLMCDEPDAIFTRVASPTMVTEHCQNKTQKLYNGHESSEVYAEQERIFLTRFRDLLSRLIIFGSIKETCSPVSQKGSGCQQENHREACSYGIAKSPPVATAKNAREMKVMLKPYTVECSQWQVQWLFPDY